MVDRVGQRYGKLLVIGRAEDGIRESNGQILPRWICQCDCGNIKIVDGGSLRAGHIVSCGCLNRIPDIIGQRYGKLTINSMFYKNKKLYYHCICVCGNEIDVCRYNLINEKQVDCGKCVRKQKPGKVRDLTGFKYGRLTVLHRGEDHVTKSGTHILTWDCQCDCGRITNVSRERLVNGKTNSCGCLQAEKFKMSIEEYDRKFKYNRSESNGIFQDLTGQRFGKLVVREQYTKTNSHKLKWICDCDCGGTAIIIGDNLKNGHTQSCGCIDSAGESNIAMYLDNIGIKYHKEKTYSDCRDKHPLPFDFGIKKGNKVVALIEYDGIQHFEPVRFNGMTDERALLSFEDCKRHDKIKNQYCINHHIPLLRIRYDEKDNLENILDTFLKEVI